MSVRTLRYNTMNQHITKSALASTDRDALAFLEAAQIYNTNQQRAIVNLVRSLKRVGLWSKMKAIYPFVGGTASSHKWNLKDPRDVDAAFRLTFSGGWTHSANGADPNGTNGYANTYCEPAAQLQLNSMHISYYSREDRTSAPSSFPVMIGAMNVSNAKRSLVYYDGATNVTMYGNINDTFTGSVDWVTYSATNAKAFFISNRPNSTTLQGWRNSTKANTRTENSDGLATSNIYIANASADNAVFSSSTYVGMQCAFVTIGDGLTDTDATNLYNIVDLYQKRLGRAV